jgi:hypothetical protein
MPYNRLAKRIFGDEIDKYLMSQRMIRLPPLRTAENETEY